MNNEVSNDFSSISPTLPSNPTTTFLTSKSHKESESKEHQEDIFDSLLRENNPLLFSQEIDTKIKLDSESLFQTTSEQIYTEIIDDVIFGLLLQVHRASKLGYLFILDPEVSPEFDKQYEIYDKNDVLGVFSNLNETYKSSGKDKIEKRVFLDFFKLFRSTFKVTVAEMDIVHHRSIIIY
jgi:hypothetical protein